MTNRFVKFQPIPDKFVLEDGTLVNKNGDILAAPTEVMKRRYKQLQPNTTRWILEDGTLINIVPNEGGGGGGEGGIPEAPTTGNYYVRRSGAWVDITPSLNSIASLESGLNTQSIRLGSVETDNVAQASRIADLETFKTQQLTINTNLENSIADIEVPDITPLTNRVTALESVNTTQNATLATHTADILELETNLTSTTTKANGAVSVNNTQNDTLLLHSGDLSNLKSDIVTLNDWIYTSLTKECAIGDIIMSGTVTPPNELFIPLDGRVDNQVIDTPAHRAAWGDAAVVALVARWGTSFPDGRGIHFRGKNSARFTDVAEIAGNTYQADAAQKIDGTIGECVIGYKKTATGVFTSVAVTNNTIPLGTGTSTSATSFAFDNSLTTRTSAETRVKSHIVYYFMRVKHPTKAILRTVKKSKSLDFAEMSEFSEINMINTRYAYNPDTLEIIQGDNQDGSVNYYGEAEFYDTAEIAGLLEHKEGYTQVYDPDTKSLSYIIDNRGLKQYSIIDGSESTIGYLGEVKEGYTLLPKPNEFSEYDSEINDWVTNESEFRTDLIIKNKSLIDNSINTIYSKLDIFQYEYTTREAQARKILEIGMNDDMDMVEALANSVNCSILDAAKMIVKHADSIKQLLKELGNVRMLKYELDNYNIDIEQKTQEILDMISVISTKIEALL